MENTPTPGIPSASSTPETPQTPLTPQPSTATQAPQAVAPTPAPAGHSRTRRILIAVGGALGALALFFGGVLVGHVTAPGDGPRGDTGMSGPQMPDGGSAPDRWGGPGGGDSEQRQAPGQQRGGQSQDGGGQDGGNSTEGTTDATSV